MQLPLGGRLQRRCRRLIDEIDDVTKCWSSVHEVGHARLHERPDIGRARRRSCEPVGGRVEPGQHLDVGAVVQRPSSAGEHLIDDDTKGPDIGERRPATVRRVGDDLGGHPT